MALNATTSTAELKAGLLANGNSTVVDNPALDALCEEFIKVVVKMMTVDAVLVVTAGIPVATAGTAAAQTGVTTAPGTGTIT